MKICWAGTQKENHCPSGFLLSSKINFKNPHAPREACAFDMAYMKIVNDMYDSIKGLCESWIAIIKKYLCLCCIFFWQRNISSSYFLSPICVFSYVHSGNTPFLFASSLNLSKEFEQERVVRKMLSKLTFFSSAPKALGYN